MNALTPVLAQQIAVEGPLTFADYMAAALYHPAHGYYTGGSVQVGRGGDYFTSVSVGPLFGRLLMRQFAEMWERLGRPRDFTVVEQGAHTGDFAHDVLAGAHALRADFAASLRYRIVEPAPTLAARQRERLVEFADQVEWLAETGEMSKYEGVYFSNELVDAFPVHVVRRVGAEWRERRVGWDGARFTWCDGPPSSQALRAHLAKLPTDLPDGYTTEVNLAAAPWLAGAAGPLRRGWLLTIDYGYPRAELYRPERITGTLSAYANHQRIDDPLSAPGEVDLTAHVDFTTLAETAVAAGLTVTGWADQHHFMAGLALLHFADTEELSPERMKETRAFKTLMHPTLMGAQFKVFCAGRAVPASPLSGLTFAKPGAAL